MGLVEQINNSPNKQFSRKNVEINTATNGLTSGSTSLLGGAYVLLGVQTNSSPCRVRLYNDSASVDLDRSRAPTNLDVADNVGLIADVFLTDNTKLTLNPPILGFPFKDGATWYNISSSNGTQALITIETYPFIQDGDSLSDKQELRIVTEKISTSGYGKSGSLATPKAFSIITGSMFRNIGLDPNFTNGSTADCNGWQFLTTTKPVESLTAADGVATPFPGTANYTAAKISTRTSAYEIGCVQQAITVTVGNTYRISGYVYGDNTTSDTAGGTRYAVGYFVHMLDGSGASLGVFNNFTTPTNPVGWYYIEGDVTIGAGTGSIQVGPLIDGPYPRGYGYTLQCSAEQDSRGCPGYGWFAGLSVINLSEGEVNGVSSRVKLFSTPLNQIQTAEFTRSFSVAPRDDSKLVADFAFDSSSRAYKLSPVLEAYTWTGSKYVEGTGQLSYQVQNTSTGGSYTNESFLISLLTHKLEN